MHINCSGSRIDIESLRICMKLTIDIGDPIYLHMLQINISFKTCIGIKCSDNMNKRFNDRCRLKKNPDLFSDFNWIHISINSLYWQDKCLYYANSKLTRMLKYWVTVLTQIQEHSIISLVKYKSFDNLFIFTLSPHAQCGYSSQFRQSYENFDIDIRGDH